jgi:hypothetical protein
MADDQTKQSGPFRIPVDWIDETAERSGKPVAIIGISPTRVKTQQDRDLERDDDGADR